MAYTDNGRKYECGYVEQKTVLERAQMLGKSDGLIKYISRPVRCCKWECVPYNDQDIFFFVDLVAIFHPVMRIRVILGTSFRKNVSFEAGNKVFISSTFEDDVGNSGYIYIYIYIISSAILNNEQGTVWKKRQNSLFLNLFKYLYLLPKML